MTSADPWFPIIDTSLCMGCGDCIRECPTSALSQQDGKAYLTHPSRCSYCAVCEALCPVSAIELPYLVVKASHQKNERERHEQ